LTVSGTTTTVNSTTVAVADSMLKVAKDNTGNATDFGSSDELVVVLN